MLLWQVGASELAIFAIIASGLLSECIGRRRELLVAAFLIALFALAAPSC